MESYLSSIKKQFEYYKILGDKTIDQVDNESLFWQFNQDSNSIGIIVKHLWGNMMSRWTDFLISDGEKDWRERDAEFVGDFDSREELLSKWNEGWNCLFSALETIDEQNLNTVVYIKNQGHTVLEACNRQLAHYAYHVGQIVFLGKMIKGEEWQSLSIPKGGSVAYNKTRFDAKKKNQHFTDEFLKKDE